MANPPTQDDRFYKPDSLLKVFGIASVVMLIFTLWMVLDDFGREWKGYQLEFFNLRKKKTEALIASTKEGLDPAKQKELEDAIAKNNEAMKGHESEIAAIDKDLISLKTKEKIATVKYQRAKIVWDVEKFEHEAHYGHYVAAGKMELSDPHYKKSADKLAANWVKVADLKDKASQLTQQIEDKEKQRIALFAEKAKLDKEMKLFRASLDQLMVARDETEITLHKLLRNAPILDLASPVLKINQTVVPTIRDDIFFARMQKIDRCTTCHLAIDTPGFENEKQPFRTHPKLDLMLSGRSPHPLENIGCTVCHGGRGQSVDFVRSAHTPRNEEQKKEWVKKYGWHEMHHVIEKMVPLQYTEGQCRVCHRQTEYVPRAAKLTESNQLVRAAGCFGCHKITGWEHMRKPAPSLKKIKGKVTRDWMVKWVRSPKSFNDHARMPASFYQSNIESDEYKSYQEAEIFAAVDFLLSESEDYNPNVRLPLGNAERGKQLFGSIGCLGCHGMDDFKQTRYGQAPNLSTVGSKVSKDWLTSWLKNPRHYWKDTTMPSLRLSDSEISDLSAYLLSKKNTDFDQKEAGQADPAVQRKVLKLYLMRDPKLAPNTVEKVDKVIAGLDDKQVGRDLGRNVVSRYGCYTCHEVKGFETTPSIAPELSEVGSKLVNKFDFGLMHLEHTNYAWINKKLEDPRIFDKGMTKEYLDLLKMPNFYFNENEIQTITTTLLGLTAQQIGAPSAKILSAREVKAEEGARVIHQYNCQGCHVVENLFQPLADDDPKKEEHDKTRHVLEGRILTYYEEDESLGPPNIHGEGKKVISSWVHDFINAPYPLRHSLKVRMPTFQMTNPEVNKIVTGWANEGDVEFPYMAPQKTNLTPQNLAIAKNLLTRLQCLNCHDTTERPSGSMEGGSRGLAPSFWHTARRLRREWIVDWLRDPQKIQPGTRMPGFWPDGNSPAPDVLGGNSEAQIQLLADYIIYLGQGVPSRPHVYPSGQTAESKPAEPKAE